MANVPDCEIVVSEFEFQSRYYIHFRGVCVCVCVCVYFRVVQSIGVK